MKKGDSDTGTRNSVDTQQEGSHLHTEEESLMRKQPYEHLDLGCLISRTVRTSMPLAYASQSVVFCHGVWSKLIH
jgi:hypothetical protein